ncbi:hypothetical protein L9F63_017725, partial [Diploptera punctata]
MSYLENYDHVFGIRGEEEFDRVYQRIQLEEQENRRNIARHRHRRIRGMHLRLRPANITLNSLQIILPDSSLNEVPNVKNNLNNFYEKKKVSPLKLHSSDAVAE